MQAKIFGAILIIFTAYWYGVLIGSKYKNRVKNLESLLIAMEMIHAEINYGLTPLPEVFRKIGQSISKPVGALFLRTSREMESCRGKSALECWTDAVNAHKNELEFNEKQLEQLEKLGMVWGKGNKSGQLKQVVLIQSFVRHALESANHELEKNDKLWRYLGLLGGITLVIFLL